MSDALVAETRSRSGLPAAVLAAGKRAFLQHRRTLDDLNQFYQCDLDVFLSAIFESMTVAARLEAA